jgi:Fic family protein
MNQPNANRSSDNELLSVFSASDDPVLTAVEVADSLDISQQAAYSKLDKAYNEGKLKRKKTGSRSVVWWVRQGSSTDSA